MSNGDEERNEFITSYARTTTGATIQRSIHRISLSMRIVIPVARERGGKFIHDDSVTDQSRRRRFREIQIAIPPFGGNRTIGRYVMYVYLRWRKYRAQELK